MVKEFPNLLSVLVNQFADLLYGENRQQRAAMYVSSGNEHPLASHRFEVLEGTSKEKLKPSYNNWCDVDRASRTLIAISLGMASRTLIAISLGMINNDFCDQQGAAPYIALVGKHGNCCGAGYSFENPAEAVRRMEEGDTLAALGGVTTVNFVVDADIAELLLTHAAPDGKRLIDAICATHFTTEAIAILSRAKCRLLQNPGLLITRENMKAYLPGQYLCVRQTLGGNYLVQDENPFILDLFSDAHRVAFHTGDPRKETLRDVVLAWGICWTSNSNTITLVKGGQLIGNGVGQQDRVGGAHLAIWRSGRSGHDVRGAVAASDSFFPFPDGLEALTKAGVTTIFATQFGANFPAVVQAAKDAGVAFITVPDGEGRGFFGH